MASWTTPVIHSTGDILAVSDWNGLANDATFLYQAPSAKYYNSVSTSCTAAAATTVTLGGTAFSNYGFSVSSGTNVVVPITGMYFVTANLVIGAGSGGGSAASPVIADIYQSGTRVSVGSNGPTNYAFPSSTTSTLVNIGSGGYFSLVASNTYGTALSTAVGADTTYLAAFFIGST